MWEFCIQRLSHKSLSSTRALLRPWSWVPGWSSWVLWTVNPLSVILIIWWGGRMDRSVSSSLLSNGSNDFWCDQLQPGRRVGLENWNSDDSFLYSENVPELFSSPPVCLNSIYSIITFGKLIKTLVWPGSGLLVSVNRDASGDMMIENAPGYLDAWTRDINTDERRDTEACLTLSALWPLTPPILGEPGHFLATPTTFSHNEREPGPRLGCPAVFSCLVTRAPWSHSIAWWAPGCWHHLKNTARLRHGARDPPEMFPGHNECLWHPCHLAFCPPDSRVTKYWSREIFEGLCCPLSVNNNKTVFTHFFNTGIERFLFVWLALHRHITEKRAADSVLGRVHHYPIIVTKPSSPGPRVSLSLVTENSHNIIQLGVKTRPPGRSLYRPFTRMRTSAYDKLGMPHTTRTKTPGQKPT